MILVIVPFYGNSGKDANGCKPARNGYGREDDPSCETICGLSAGAQRTPYLQPSTNWANWNDTERISRHLTMKGERRERYQKMRNVSQEAIIQRYKTDEDGGKMCEIPRKVRPQKNRTGSASDWWSAVLYILIQLGAFCRICPKRIYLRPFHSFTLLEYSANIRNTKW